MKRIDITIIIFVITFFLIFSFVMIGVDKKINNVSTKVEQIEKEIKSLKEKLKW